MWAAGGEPVVLHPADGDVRGRLWFADGFLLPGGGDLAAHWYGQQAHPTLYDVVEERTRSTSPSHGSLSRRRLAVAGDLPWQPGRQRRATVDVVDDPAQAAVFMAFVRAARDRRPSCVA